MCVDVAVAGCAGDPPAGLSVNWLRTRNGLLNSTMRCRNMAPSGRRANRWRVRPGDPCVGSPTERPRFSTGVNADQESKISIECRETSSLLQFLACVQPSQPAGQQVRPLAATQRRGDGRRVTRHRRTHLVRVRIRVRVRVWARARARGRGGGRGRGRGRVRWRARTCRRRRCR